MQWLNWSYARSYNTSYGLHGHVFSGAILRPARSKARRASSDVDDYVLANPVRAGLCASIEDWPWSFSRYAPRLRRF